MNRPYRIRLPYKDEELDRIDRIFVALLGNDIRGK